MRLINIALITILLLVLDGLAEQVLARSWLTGSSQSVSINLKFRLQQADVMAELTSFNNAELLGKLLSIRGGSSPSLLSRMVNFLHKLLESIFGLRPKQHQKSNRKLKPAAIANKLHPNKAVGRNEIAKKKAFDGEKGHPSSSAVSSSSGTNRLRKEMQNFLQNPPSNCKLNVDPKNFRSWTVTLTGAKDTPYDGEEYKLRMEFPKDYPAKPPSVYFLKPVPKHQHVYSNGDICLNLLGRDWRPILTAEVLALSILSMLSSAREKTSPQGNAMLSDTPPGQQQTDWMYHDDRC